MTVSRLLQNKIAYRALALIFLLTVTLTMKKKEAFRPITPVLRLRGPSSPP
jgi:hypothetical protein